MAEFTVERVADVTTLSADEMAEVLALYAAVGWTAYTARPDTLAAGLRGSSYLAVVRDADRLVGLVRAVSDDATVCLVQDLLVHPDVQRRGIGSALLAAVGERYAHVRQHVLVTDDEERQRRTYERAGFAETRDLGPLRAFLRYR